MTGPTARASSSSVYFTGKRESPSSNLPASVIPGAIQLVGKSRPTMRSPLSHDPTAQIGGSRLNKVTSSRGIRAVARDRRIRPRAGKARQQRSLASRIGRRSLSEPHRHKRFIRLRQVVARGRDGERQVHDHLPRSRCNQHEADKAATKNRKCIRTAEPPKTWSEHRLGQTNTSLRPCFGVERLCLSSRWARFARIEVSTDTV